MLNPRWHLSFSDLLWGTLALMGCLGMLAFEAIAMRLTLGKW
jgi:hypothetical protein